MPCQYKNGRSSLIALFQNNGLRKQHVIFLMHREGFVPGLGKVNFQPVGLAPESQSFVQETPCSGEITGRYQVCTEDLPVVKIDVVIMALDGLNPISAAIRSSGLHP
jgi:hypothetical protein